MEMILRPQSPLGSRGRPELVVRPAASAAAATGLGQSVLRCCRFTGGRLIRCMVASSDYPKRNPKGTSTPKPNGTASRGYASRPPAESSKKKVEKSSADDIDHSGSNGKPRIEATEPSGIAKESTEVDLPADISSSATKEGLFTDEEAETKKEAGQNQSLALSSTSINDDSIDRKLDEYRGKINALVSSKPEASSSSIASVPGQPVVEEQHKSQEDDRPIGRPFVEAIGGYAAKKFH